MYVLQQVLAPESHNGWPPDNKISRAATQLVYRSLGAEFTASTQFGYQSLGAELTAQIFCLYDVLEPVKSTSHVYPATGSGSGGP